MWWAWHKLRRMGTLAANTTVEEIRFPGARHVPGAIVIFGRWRRIPKAARYHCSEHDRWLLTCAGSESWRGWEEGRRSRGRRGIFCCRLWRWKLSYTPSDNWFIIRGIKKRGGGVNIMKTTPKQLLRLPRPTRYLREDGDCNEIVLQYRRWWGKTAIAANNHEAKAWLRGWTPERPICHGCVNIISATAVIRELSLKEDLLLWEGHHKWHGGRQGWNCDGDCTIWQQGQNALPQFSSQTSLSISVHR